MARIIIDEKVRHGKPIIEGTGITVDEVLQMLEEGLSYEDIKKEYNLTKEQILAAIHYAASFIRGEEVQKIPA